MHQHESHHLFVEFVVEKCVRIGVDPLDCGKDEASVRDDREKEGKHGLPATMGALGMLTQSLVQVPVMEGASRSVNAITVFVLVGAREATVLPAGSAEGAS